MCARRWGELIGLDHESTSFFSTATKIKGGKNVKVFQSKNIAGATQIIIQASKYTVVLVRELKINNQSGEQEVFLFVYMVHRPGNRF